MGRDPRGSLDVVERSLTRFAGTDFDMGCGEFLVLGARAVADLTESARARRDGEGNSTQAWRVTG